MIQNILYSIELQFYRSVSTIKVMWSMVSQPTHTVPGQIKTSYVANQQ